MWVRLAFSLSVVLVLVCSLPNVTLSAPTGVHSRCPGVMSEIDTFSFAPIGRDGLAEWSKALASGASPKGRGFLPCAGNPLWEIQTRSTWQSRCVLRGCVGVGVMRHAYHLAQFLPPPGDFIIIIITLDHLLKNGEMVLAGSVCLNGMKVDNIVQTFHYVPVDFKLYTSTGNFSSCFFYSGRVNFLMQLQFLAPVELFFKQLNGYSF